MRYKNPELLKGMSDYIGEFLLAEGHVPSNREVAEHFGVCKSQAQKYMSTIAKQRLCKAWENYNDEYSKTSVVDMGLSCGIPTYEDECVIEYTRLPNSIFGDEEKLVAHANGTSMQDAGIEDGDTLILSDQKTAREGEVVLATLNGALLIKTYLLHEDGRPYLHPENEEFNDIEIHEDDAFYIQGVLLYVLKNYRGFKSQVMFKE